MNPDTKPLNTEGQPVPTAAEHVAAYGYSTTFHKSVLASYNNQSHAEINTAKMEDYYDQLKTEANNIYGNYGKGKTMTPDEYFDKLRYVVEGLYEHV